MGGKRARRKRLATGIFEDAYGVSVVVRGRAHRYPLGTPLEQLRRDRRELVDAAGATPSRRRTLAAGVAAYLETVPDEGRRRRDKATLLQHWLDAGLGALAMDGVKPIDLRKQMAVWSGFAPQPVWPCAKPSAPPTTPSTGDPGRDVPQPRVRYDEPRGITYDLIEELFTYMPDRGMPVQQTRRYAQAASALRAVAAVNAASMRLPRARRKTAKRSTNRAEAQPSVVTKKSGHKRVIEPVC